MALSFKQFISESIIDLYKREFEKALARVSQDMNTLTREFWAPPVGAEYKLTLCPPEKFKELCDLALSKYTPGASKQDVEAIQQFTGNTFNTFHTQLLDANHSTPDNGELAQINAVLLCVAECTTMSDGDNYNYEVRGVSISMWRELLLDPDAFDEYLRGITLACIGFEVILENGQIDK